MLNLNIGAGDKPLPGFVSIDAKLGHDALKLPYKDGEVDEVYASHVLEHIDRNKTLDALREWVRVLKPGGRIRVAVPDFSKVIQLHLGGVLDLKQVEDWAYGTTEKYNQHKAFFNEETLATALRACAVDNIERVHAEFDDWSASPASINLSGTKRVVVIPENPKVSMVLSTGRFVPGELMDCATKVAKELGWNLYSFVAPGDWGKGLTSAVYQAINADDPDYIMFLDHDSVFTTDDCRELLRLIQENPDYGAIWPVQTHRHMDVPLGFDTGGRGGIDYTTELTALPSGHFGCSIMRTQVLKTIPEPWFMSMPSPIDGKWNMQNIDADLYLWAQLTFHGFKMGQANNVQIGHLEWCVKWTAPKGVIWQPIQNYRKNGKPSNAVFDGKYWSNGEWKEQCAQVPKPVETPPSAPAEAFLHEIEQSRQKPHQNGKMERVGASVA